MGSVENLTFSSFEYDSTTFPHAPCGRISKIRDLLIFADAHTSKIRNTLKLAITRIPQTSWTKIGQGRHHQ